MTTQAETTLLSTELLAECEALLPMLATEFADRRLYAMNKPFGFPDTGYAAAFVGAKINHDLRDALIAEDRWKGPGHIIAFCMPMSRDEALGATVHEGGHLLEFDEPNDHEIDSLAYRNLQRAMVAVSFSGIIGDSKTMPAWYKLHGWQFIRRCVHLHYRAWKIGCEIGLPEINVAGWRYDLSPAWEYMHSLGSEPKRMATATFDEIASEPAPREFRELFRNDYLEWVKNPTAKHQIGE